MITVARIDERLIHGQVGYSWTVAYKSDAVMVVDNEVSKDEFQVSLLKMACPASLKCFVVDEDRAVQLLAKYPKKKFFIVVGHPCVYLNMIDRGAEIASINVGGIYFKEGRRQVSKTVYVDDDMERVFKALDGKGVKLEVRTTPTDSEEKLMDLLG